MTATQETSWQPRLALFPQHSMTPFVRLALVALCLFLATSGTSLDHSNWPLIVLSGHQEKCEGPLEWNLFAGPALHPRKLSPAVGHFSAQRWSYHSVRRRNYRPHTRYLYLSVFSSMVAASILRIITLRTELWHGSGTAILLTRYKIEFNGLERKLPHSDSAIVVVH